jgi:hypothetical protein
MSFMRMVGPGGFEPPTNGLLVKVTDVNCASESKIGYGIIFYVFRIVASPESIPKLKPLGFPKSLVGSARFNRKNPNCSMD